MASTGIASEKKLFLKRAFKNLRQLGSVAPSSIHLGEEMARHLDAQADYPIVELGGGTGSLTRAILSAGIDPQRLYTLELDEELCSFLQNEFPDCHVIHGCAGQLEKILPKEIHGKVKAIVSGLPLLNFPTKAMDQVVESALSIMAPEGYMLQYTYSPRSPLPAERYGLQKDKLRTVLRNIPPATVWKYWR